MHVNDIFMHKMIFPCMKMKILPPEMSMHGILIYETFHITNLSCMKVFVWVKHVIVRVKLRVFS